MGLKLKLESKAETTGRFHLMIANSCGSLGTPYQSLSSNKMFLTVTEYRRDLKIMILFLNSKYSQGMVEF